MRIVVLFFVRFHLNKEFPDWKGKKKELKTNDLTHPWVDLDYIQETNGIPRREQIVWIIEAQPGLAPDHQQPGFLLCPPWVEDGGGGCFQVETSTGPLPLPSSAQTCPITTPITHMAAFFCPSSGGGSGACHQGSVNLSLSASTFPEGHAPPRCLKVHLGPPVGCLRLPHTRNRVSCFLVAFLPVPAWLSRAGSVPFTPFPSLQEAGLVTQAGPLPSSHWETSPALSQPLHCLPALQEVDSLRHWEGPQVWWQWAIVGACSLTVVPSRGNCWSRATFK